MFRQVADPLGLVRAAIGLGNLARLQRRFTDAERAFTEALDGARRQSARREEVLALEFMGELEFDRERPEAAKGNPGPAGAGWLIRDGQGKVLSRQGRNLGRATNNEAEYQALIGALEESLALGRREEVEHSTYSFEEADVPFFRRQFESWEAGAARLLDRATAPLDLPAHEAVLKCSHLFNVLDARGALSVTERAAHIQRIRKLACRVADAYLAQSESMGFPLLAAASR